MEVTNRFKAVDLIDRVPKELGTEIQILYKRESSKPSPRKKNAKSQNGYLMRPYK